MDAELRRQPCQRIYADESMKTYELDETCIGSGKIFPAEIENRPWIGFHGTTGYHAKLIEQSGIQPFKTLTLEEWETLKTVGPTVDPMLWQYVESFRGMKKVNFFTISEWALKHTKCRGGQGLITCVKPLVQKILDTATNGTNQSILKLLSELLAKISVIEQSPPVIYAVNLKDQQNICYNRSALAVQVKGIIGAEKLEGKMNAPKFCKHDQIDLKSLIKAAKILINPELKHFVSQLPLCDD